MTAAKKTPGNQKLEESLSLLNAAVTLTRRNALVVDDYRHDMKLGYVFHMAARIIEQNDGYQPKTATVTKAEDAYVRIRFFEMAANLVKPIHPTLDRDEATIARDTIVLGKGLYEIAQKMKFIKVLGAKPR